MFLNALAWLDASNSPETLFVGDNPIADIEGAQNVGMITVWVTCGRSWPENLTPPDHRVTSVPDVWALLPVE
jgi:putative hydrolase of the HAD superfamily